MHVHAHVFPFPLCVCVCAMQFLFDNLLPYLGDADSATHRQGAIETVACIHTHTQPLSKLLSCLHTVYEITNVVMVWVTICTCTDMYSIRACELNIHDCTCTCAYTSTYVTCTCTCILLCRGHMECSRDEFFCWLYTLITTVKYP